MSSASMCFSVLQSPRCKLLYLLKGNSVLPPISFNSIWYQKFNDLGSTHGRNYSSVLGANTNRHSGETSPPRTWKLKMQQKITRNVHPGDNKIQSIPCTVSPDELYPKVVSEGAELNADKSNFSKYELLDGVVAAGNKSNVDNSKVDELEASKHCDVQKNIECKDVKPLATVIAFDIETTGFSREDGRIIEIALKDLKGGENSTFQTLVNPEQDVPNAYVHGISTYMVCRRNVPRFKDLIPILRYYVKSRQIPESPVLLVAHNARSFDVPFLVNEFSRCSEEIPSDWLFFDTLPLAREFAKLKEPGLSKKSLKALCEHFNIKVEGKAHRAMSDVHSLSMVLREMTIAMELPLSSLLERSFKVSDLASSKKNAN